MNLGIHNFTPHPALLEYIENINVMHFDFSKAKKTSFYSYFPNHTRFLSLYSGNRIKVKKQNENFKICEQAVIGGPQLLPLLIDLGKEHKGVVVSFKPSGMYRLLGVPQKEIINHCLDARDILGKETDELVNYIHEAETDEEINKIVQNYLLIKLKNLKPAQPFDRAILQLTRANGNLSMKYISSQSCLSLRQFERLSLIRIGMSPKLYARLVRFSQAFKFKEDCPATPWMEIAYRYGYYDYMHFIHEFKAFVERTPTSIKEDEFLASLRF